MIDAASLSWWTDLAPGMPDPDRAHDVTAAYFPASDIVTCSSNTLSAPLGYVLTAASEQAATHVALAVCDDAKGRWAGRLARFLAADLHRALDRHPRRTFELLPVVR